MNFLHFAALLFAVCVVVLVGVSLTTPAQPRDSLAGLTYATAGKSEPTQARGLLIGASLVVAAGVAVTWLVFR